MQQHIFATTELKSSSMAALISLCVQCACSKPLCPRGSYSLVDCCSHDIAFLHLLLLCKLKTVECLALLHSALQYLCGSFYPCWLFIPSGCSALYECSLGMVYSYSDVKAWSVDVQQQCWPFSFCLLLVVACCRCRFLWVLLSRVVCILWLSYSANPFCFQESSKAGFPAKDAFDILTQFSTHAIVHVTQRHNIRSFYSTPHRLWLHYICCIMQME